MKTRQREAGNNYNDYNLVYNPTTPSGFSTILQPDNLKTQQREADNNYNNYNHYNHSNLTTRS